MSHARILQHGPTAPEQTKTKEKPATETKVPEPSPDGKDVGPKTLTTGDNGKKSGTQEVGDAVKGKGPKKPSSLQQPTGPLVHRAGRLTTDARRGEPSSSASGSTSDVGSRDVAFTETRSEPGSADPVIELKSSSHDPLREFRQTLVNLRGRGDGFVLSFGEREILIDGGFDATAANQIRAKIQNGRIHLRIVLTHADSDHIRNAVQFLDTPAFKVDEVVISAFDTETATRDGLTRRCGCWQDQRSLQPPA